MTTRTSEQQTHAFTLGEFSALVLALTHCAMCVPANQKSIRSTQAGSCVTKN